MKKVKKMLKIPKKMEIKRKQRKKPIWKFLELKILTVIFNKWYKLVQIHFSKSMKLTLKKRKIKYCKTLFQLSFICFPLIWARIHMIRFMIVRRNAKKIFYNNNHPRLNKKRNQSSKKLLKFMMNLVTKPMKLFLDKTNSS